MNRNILKIHVSSSFMKSFSKLPPFVKKLAGKKDILFRLNAFDSRLRTHKLKGDLDGYYAYSVNLQYRILFRFLDTHQVIYYDIGTHEIYN